VTIRDIAATTSSIIVWGNSGIEGDGVKVGVGDRVGDNEGVGVGNGLGECDSNGVAVAML
jgi:hypothetical protein